MGAYDREYMREDPPNSIFGRKGGGVRGWSPVTWLLVLNVAVFVIHSLLNMRAVEIWWAALSFDALKAGLAWTPVTYMFLHDGLFHLLGNMLGLFFIGRALCQLIGNQRFLIIYFVGGVLGGLLQILVSRHVPVIGASGGVFAILIALAALMPHHRITMLLFFVIPIRTTLKRMAIFVLAFDVALMVLSYIEMFSSLSIPNIGHLAHLGGAAFGFVYIRYFLKNSQEREFERQRTEQQKARFGTRSIVDAEEVQQPVAKRPVSFRGERSSYVSPDVDAILDKISAEGMQSLTDEERRLLADSSEQIARRTGGR